jgi:hypothetical protein
MAGRKPGSIQPPYRDADRLFAGERCDESQLQDVNYEHSTFANVSFLDAKISRGHFRNCAFVECYFRNADLRQLSFVGCKFINCTFDHITIRDCDFRYAEFRGQSPPYTELAHSAPQQANLRHQLFDQLARISESSGDTESARRYRQAAIDALDKHLRAAVRAETAWYREHFDSWGRVGAAVRLFWHKLNRILWAHGDSAWRLLASAFVVILIVFPVLFLIFRDGLRSSAGEVSASDVVWLSLSNFLLIDRVSPLEVVSGAALALSATEALLGIIFAGLYVTLLIKALLRR